MASAGPTSTLPQNVLLNQYTSRTGRLMPAHSRGQMYWLSVSSAGMVRCESTWCARWLSRYRRYGYQIASGAWPNRRFTDGHGVGWPCISSCWSDMYQALHQIMSSVAGTVPNTRQLASVSSQPP